MVHLNTIVLSSVLFASALSQTTRVTSASTTRPTPTSSCRLHADYWACGTTFTVNLCTTTARNPPIVPTAVAERCSSLNTPLPSGWSTAYPEDTPTITTTSTTTSTTSSSSSRSASTTRCRAHADYWACGTTFTVDLCTTTTDRYPPIVPTAVAERCSSLNTPLPSGWSTAYPTGPTTTPPPAPPVSMWGQCGGIGHTGGTACVATATCSTLNAYYYQCLP